MTLARRAAQGIESEADSFLERHLELASRRDHLRGCMRPNTWDLL